MSLNYERRREESGPREWSGFRNGVFDNRVTEHFKGLGSSIILSTNFQAHGKIPVANASQLIKDGRTSEGLE